MSIAWRSAVIGAAVAVIVALLFDQNLTLKPLLLIFGVVGIFGGIALRSWWSMVVVPVALMSGFWLIVAWRVFVEHGVRVTEDLGYQVLFVSLLALLAAHFAAVGALIGKVLEPSPS
jgi:hypothetical protein